MLLFRLELLLGTYECECRFYKEYASEGEREEDFEADDDFDVDQEIEKFRKTVNTADPSLEDIKEILRFAVEISKKKILAYSRKFKAERRRFTNATRKTKMTEYMNVLANGMEEVQNLGISQQQHILSSLGV